MSLIDVRCPLKRKDDPGKQCNCLCVRVEPGSRGKAYCRRHDVEFEFEVDAHNSISDIMRAEKPLQSDQIATTEHPITST